MSLQVLNQEQIVPASSAISEPSMQTMQTIQSTNAEEASSSACASSHELGNANTHEHLASLNFPIVVLGASAGGLAAFKEVFSSFKENPTPEMAFVVIQHLAPDVDSMLCELIQQDTLMPVLSIEEGMPIQVNHVYVITPDCALSCVDGVFHLLAPTKLRGARRVLDRFLSSLAHDQHARVIAVILSGTGSDGSAGIREIKKHGGWVIVQSPETAEYDGMPRSARATACADAELALPAVFDYLQNYARHTLSIAASHDMEAQSQSLLKKVFALVRVQTGHDFSFYKPGTIFRRIERRMGAHQILQLADYVLLLEKKPEEVDALFRDFLIGVTNFFRDPEVFQIVHERILNEFLPNQVADKLLRVWVAACSTGEEAYSLAMVFQECLELHQKNIRIQIFATDIDPRAIAFARAGLYPASIAENVSPERLARFFTVDSDTGGYRVRKSLRDLLIFSEHNLIKDPPFSRLDWISCRNLLIYLDAEVQKKLIPLFHYALTSNGHLLLGASEGIGEFEKLFNVINRKAKLYQRKELTAATQRSALGRFVPSLFQQDGVANMPLALAPPSPMIKTNQTMKLSLKELTEQSLLQQCTPAGALVNAQGDILYLHGRAGMFLELAPGEVGVSNILKMAREGLQHELAMCLHKAVTSNQVMRMERVHVQTNGQDSLVNVSVHPVTYVEPTDVPLFLVSFEYLGLLADVNLAARSSSSASTEGQLSLNNVADTDQKTSLDGHAALLAKIAFLEQQLQSKNNYLQSAREELESSNEELKSSNEEMQSVNEELQSTNEELETSKEELQSVNEELSTVNSELYSKVSDLTRANNDMNNLLAGTGIGTVFVDHELRIMRFTPAASQFINLIQSDTGRPVGHIVSNLLAYDSLTLDVQTVLDSLVPIQLEVQTRDGKWCTMRIQPYRTLENVIEGVVISFVDISDIVKTRLLLQDVNALTRLAVVVRDASDAIIVQNLEGRILAWNQSAEKLYGWTEDEALKLNFADRLQSDEKPTSLQQLNEMRFAATHSVVASKRLRKDGTLIDVSVTSSALLNVTGEAYAIATTECLVVRQS